MSDVLFSMTREQILGHPGVHQISDLGIVQFRHSYPTALLDRIAREARRLKAEVALKRHLDLLYIRGAHRYIPEILEVVNHPGRLALLSQLAGVKVEPYPISVISTIITFAGPSEGDGNIRWHADGVPASELVPLAIDDLEGGDLEVYRGPAEEGLYYARRGFGMDPARLVRLRHQPGFSVFGQLMRVAHRVTPITRGSRITLNMNIRSAVTPYIDDNSMFYLAADNPDFDWVDEYVQDVRERQLPAYLERARS